MTQPRSDWRRANLVIGLFILMMAGYAYLQVKSRIEMARRPGIELSVAIHGLEWTDAFGRDPPEDPSQKAALVLDFSVTNHAAIEAEFIRQSWFLRDEDGNEYPAEGNTAFHPREDLAFKSLLPGHTVRGKLAFWAPRNDGPYWLHCRGYDLEVLVPLIDDVDNTESDDNTERRAGIGSEVVRHGLP